MPCWAGTVIPAPAAAEVTPSTRGGVAGMAEGKGERRKTKRKKVFKLCSAYAAPATVPVLQRVAAKLGWDAVDKADADAGGCQRCPGHSASLGTAPEEHCCHGRRAGALMALRTATGGSIRIPAHSPDHAHV